MGSRLPNLLSKLHKHEWIVIVVAAVVILRIPSLFEPYWYGDEAIYLTLGQAMNKGVQLYSQIHDNKPPLLYVAAAVAEGNQFWFKFLAMGWSLLTVGVFIELAEKVFEGKKKLMAAATTGFVLLTTLPFWEGNIANAELFFLLPTLLAVNWLWKKNAPMKNVVMAGLALGVGALFKMPAVLEAGVWPLVWLASGEKEIKKKMVVLVGAVAAPIVISGLYFAGQGSLGNYITAAWAQNIPYLSSWKASSGGEGIFSLTGRAAVAAVLVAVVWGLNRTWGRKGTIVGIWGVVAVFGALLSGRPYPHYLLQAAGVAVIALVMLGEKKKTEKLVGGGVVAMVVAAYLSFNFYNYETVKYYGNFLRWMWGKQSLAQYYDWFGNGVNRNYEIAGIIKGETEENERVFVWGDEPMIYALAGRLPVGKYTVKYHIKDFGAQEETMRLLRSAPPKIVVSFGQEEELPGLAAWLQDYYALEKEVGGAKIYRWTKLSAIVNRL